MQQAQYGGYQQYPSNQPSAYAPNSAPINQNTQWPAQQPTQQQWNQTQQQPMAPGYNPNTYGAMPGASSSSVPPPPPPKPTYYPSTQTGPSSFQSPVQLHQQPVHATPAPPPVPNLPQGYQSEVQQNQQGWPQRPQYTNQPASHRYEPHSHTSYNQGGQQASYGAGVASQPGYNTNAPRPPSQTTGGSYFPPAQTSGPSAYAAQPPSTVQSPPGQVLSPNEQQPAYIPPSLTGQGVAAYMPTNTNPMPGVYVPPPPENVPAWQQQQHAPLAGKKFKYTGLNQPGNQPSATGGFGSYQQTASASQQPNAYGQPAQQGGQYQSSQFPPPLPPRPQYQSAPPTQYGHTQHNPQQTYGQVLVPPAYLSQQQQGYVPPAYSTPIQTSAPPVWPPSAQAPAAQNYSQAQHPFVQAPKPIEGQLIGSAGSSYSPNVPYSETSSTDQAPVSPISHRQSISFSNYNQAPTPQRKESLSSLSRKPVVSRTNSINIASQRKPGTPSAFALGAGGPSDWEHFGPATGEEVDDDVTPDHPSAQEFVAELPAHNSPPPERQDARLQSKDSVVSEIEDWPTPPAPAPLNVRKPKVEAPQNTHVIHEAPANEVYVPTPPITTQDCTPMSSRRGTPGTGQQPIAPPAGANFVMDEGGWEPSADEKKIDAQHSPADIATKRVYTGATVPEPSTSFVMEDSGLISPPEQSFAKQPHQALDVLADVDPWYTSSRDRYASMLRQEADAASVEEKHKIFVDFITSEAQLRRIVFPPAQQPPDETELNRLRDLNRTLESDNVLLKEKSVAAIASEESLKAEIAQLHTTASTQNATQQALGAENASLKERLQAAAADKTARQALEAETASLKQQLENVSAEKAKAQALETETNTLKQQLQAAEQKHQELQKLENDNAFIRQKLEAAQESKEELKERIVSLETQLLELSAEHEALKKAPPSVATQKPALSNLVSPSHLGVNQSLEQNQSNRPPMERGPVSAPVVHMIQQPVVQPVPSHDSRERSATMTAASESTGTYKPYRQSVVVTSSEPSPQSIILTPASSTSGDQTKDVTPDQVAYKPYIPPVSEVSSQRARFHSDSVSSPSGTPRRQEHEEFFIEPLHPKKPETPVTVAPPTKSRSPSPPPQRSSSALPNKDLSPLAVLEHSLPRSPTIASLTDSYLDKLINTLPTDTTWIKSLHQTFEASAASIRSENEKARHSREQEAEERHDQLFNDNEIGYGDITALEESFKAQEGQRKRQEERKEYNDYVSQIFEPVFNRLQKEITVMTNTMNKVKSLVETAKAGKDSFTSPDKLLDENEHSIDLRAGLNALVKIQSAIDAHCDIVALGINDRDKRVKRTELGALYAAGNVPKLKAAEKHFEQAAKVAVCNAAREKATRVKRLFEVIDEAVIRGVGANQGYMDIIMGHLHDLKVQEDIPDTKEARDTLDKALSSFQALANSSSDLMGMLHQVELLLSNAEHQYAIAEAKLQDAPESKIKALAEEKGKRDVHSKKELERRVGLVQEDVKGAKEAVEEVKRGLKVELSEAEKEKQERLKLALEEAKRRNGETV